MILEGAKLFEASNLKIDPILQQLCFLKCNVVKEIDQSHKIIKFSYVRKFSADYRELCQRSPDVKLGNIQDKDSTDTSNLDHYMLVSYTVQGNNQDRACISLFEIDMNRMMIAPQNFVIITQQIDKDAKPVVIDNCCRTLSAVAEEPMEQEAGSFSTKNLTRFNKFASKEDTFKSKL